MQDSRELVLAEEAPPEGLPARVGGCALLPSEIEWPCAPDGSPLSLVFSVPASFLGTWGFEADRDDLLVSGFLYYSMTDYCLDKVASNDQESFRENVGTFSRVLIHAPDVSRSLGIQLPAKGIALGERIEGTATQGSRIGGRPGFLQSFGDAACDLVFAFQLYSSDLSEAHADILGLPDSVGYVFLPSMLSDSKEGVFFAQCT